MQLASSFLKRFAERQGKDIDDFTEESKQALENWTWPGNVRELENVIERAATLQTTGQVELGSLPGPLVEAWRLSAGIESSEKAAASSLDEGQDSSEPVSRDRVIVLPHCLRLPSPVFDKADEKPIDMPELIKQVESIYLKAAISSTGKSAEKAARLLGITVKEFKLKVAQLKLDQVDN